MKGTYAFFHGGKHLNLDVGAGERRSRYSIRLEFIFERMDLYEILLLEEYSHIYADMVLFGCEYSPSVNKILGRMIAKKPLDVEEDEPQEDIIEEVQYIMEDDIVKSFNGKTLHFESGATISSAEIKDSFIQVEPNIDIKGASVADVSLQPSSEEGEKVGLTLKLQTDFEDIEVKSCAREGCEEPSDVLVVAPENDFAEIIKTQRSPSPTPTPTSPKIGVEMFWDPEARNAFLLMEDGFDVDEKQVSQDIQDAIVDGKTSILAIFVSLTTKRKITTLVPEKLREIFNEIGPLSDEDENVAMEKAIDIKFSIDSYANKLKSTKTKSLVYNNSAEDYWGIRWGNSLSGDNNYGKLLMNYRERLMTTLQSPKSPETREYGLSPRPVKIIIETDPIPLEEEESVQVEPEPPQPEPKEEIIIETDPIPLEENVPTPEKPQSEEESVQPEEKEELPQAEPGPKAEIIIETEPIPLEENVKPEPEETKETKEEKHGFCDDELKKIDRSLILSRFDDRLMRGTIIKYENSILDDLFRAYDVGLFGGKLTQEMKNGSLKIQISWEENGDQDSPGVSDASKTGGVLLCTLALSKNVFAKLSGNRKGKHNVFGIECSTQFEVVMVFMESFVTMTAMELCNLDSTDPELYSTYSSKFFGHQGSECNFSPPDDDLRQRILKLKSDPTAVVKVTLKDGKEYEVAGARSTSEIMLNDGDEKKRVPYSEVTHLNGEPL